MRSTTRSAKAGGSAAELRALRELAELHSVMPAFTDASGKRRTASVESLRAVLHGLGVSANNPKEVTAARKAADTATKSRILEPVNVVWNDAKPSVAINNVKGPIDCTLQLETGETHRWSIPASKSAIKAVRLPDELPLGYHKLTITPARGAPVTTTIISAPVRSWSPQSDARPRHWGLFTPVYALRSSRDMGHGDLTEWRELARWADAHGARAFATLPLLPAFLDEPFDPSPYAPISRLFWNELFADVTRSAEFSAAPGNGSAPGLLRSGAERREIGELRALPLVDYKRSATLQRTALDRLSRIFFENKGDQSPAYKKYVEQHPELPDYAKFRAVGERLRSTWDQWPARLRDGQLKSSDYDDAIFRRHLYSQFLVGTQLAECAGEMEGRGQLPYLDLPVGVSPFGYDVWKRRAIWADACSTGAPPDPYFTTGQNWGFPPMHPERCRDEAYAYVIASLRHHMRHSAYLRADHVMALHRLFWIPTGASPADGVYVTYNADEMWAILCLESHRNHCRVVGENLGTVPKAVNDRMVRHDVGQLYVVQYELNPDAKTPLRDIPANSAASINTHDMAQFAHYIEGGDVDDRVRLNMLAPEKSEAEHETRERAKKALAKFLASKKLLPPHVSAKDADAASLTEATLKFLAASDAEIVLVNMEDLWQELHWQNIPGTQHEHDNWRHKLTLDLDALRSSPNIAAIFKAINDARTTTPKATKHAKTTKKKTAPKKKPRRLASAR